MTIVIRRNAERVDDASRPLRRADPLPARLIGQACLGDQDESLGADGGIRTPKAATQPLRMPARRRRFPRSPAGDIPPGPMMRSFARPVTNSSPSAQ